MHLRVDSKDKTISPVELSEPSDAQEAMLHRARPIRRRKNIIVHNLIVKTGKRTRRIIGNIPF